MTATEVGHGARGARGGRRAVAGTTWPRLALFMGLAVAVVIADQVSKAWVDRSFALSRASDVVAAPLAPPTPVIGDFVRIAKGYNNGAIFSLFGSSASFFAIASLVAIVVILWYEITRGGRASILLTLTLGLLMGGAIGNEIDRLRLGYVIDFVDMGIGTWRWYTFNVADASISVSIVLLLVIGIVGDVGRPQEGSGAVGAGAPGGGTASVPGDRNVPGAGDPSAGDPSAGDPGDTGAGDTAGPGDTGTAAGTAAPTDAGGYGRPG